MIRLENLSRALNYAQYVQLIKELFNAGRSTGLTQTQEYLEYTKINLQRMQRLEKTIVLMPEFERLLSKIKGNYYFVVLSEGWCGDAAQNVPLFEVICQHCEAFELKILLRDENAELMDQYLTNGSRSIPKLICIEKDSLAEKFTWGPRPAVLQQKVVDMLARGANKEEKGLMVQQWYNNDKTVTAQKELYELVRNL
jgi:hypothetical protein